VEGLEEFYEVINFDIGFDSLSLSVKMIYFYSLIFCKPVLIYFVYTRLYVLNALMKHLILLVSKC